MKILKTLSRLTLCALTAFAVAACSSETTIEPVPEPEVPGGGNDVDPEAPVNGEMKAALLRGFVTDTDGNPLTGVTVTSGTHSCTTDRMGSFSLSEADVNEGRSIVTFSKDGYFKLVRSLAFTSAEDWTVVLCRKGNNNISVEKDFTSQSGAELKIGKMVNRLPADGFKNRATGEPYTGKVKAEMVYLDPNDDTFAEMMPGGDLAAVDASQERVQLISYGMTAVNLSDENGTALQLADGSEATLQFPIPAGMEADAPAEMPLWSFNESTGLWEQEGMAVKKGDHYEGTVKHFSWVNLDYPEREGTVNVQVTDTDGKPVPNLIVRIGQVNARTGINGTISQQVPANTSFTVTVEPRYYGNYSPQVSVSVSAIPAKGSRSVNLVLPAMKQVSGTVIRGNDPAGDCVVWIENKGYVGLPAHTGVDGKFSLAVSESLRGDSYIHVLTPGGEEKSFAVSLNGQNVDAGVLQVGEIMITPGAMDPMEAKAYIEETGRKVVGYMVPEEQRALIELCSYFERVYGDYEMPSNWESATYQAPGRFMGSIRAAVAHNDLPSLARSAAQSWNVGLYAGEYVPDGQSERWVKVAESKDVVFSFPYKGNTAVMRVSPSEATWTMTYDELTVKVPERIDVNLSVGGSAYVTAVMESKYDAVRHTMRLDTEVTAANIGARETLRGEDKKIELNGAVTVGGTTIFVPSATVTGVNMLNPSYLNQLFVVERDEYDEWTELNTALLREMFHTAGLRVDVLDRMSVRAESRDVAALLDLDDIYFDSEDYDSKEEARTACQQVCDRVMQLVSNSVYLAGSDVSSASLILRPSLREESYGSGEWAYEYWEWSPEPLLYFAKDGSSYNFEDYFSGAGFTSLESQVRSIMEAYYNIWNSGR